ncbi:hypothetical protein [Micromonospora aurantiaca (nom. illeg.)]|uniref:hypothetical protein n=1 Tax=Micromonospora aurantiaca (nom. illeg.) TaxID=47850 RepID=UPI003F49FD35
MSGILATATTAKSGTTCTATVNGVDTLVQVARDLTVAVGDVLLVERIGAQWFTVQRLFTAAPAVVDNDTPPPPKPTVTTGTLVISPVETRSYRPNWGWRTDTTDVYQGEFGSNGNHTGCAFYGRKARSLAGATVTKATIRVKRLSAGTYAGQPTTLRLLSQSTRPGGAPTLGSSTAGPSLAVGATGTFTIPDSWGQAMVGGSAGGLALFQADGSPYVRYAGRGSWSPAFTLALSWRRG